MPNVRASSGTMGTTSLPISGSRSILRSIPTNAIVVETSRPSLPVRNSLNSSSWSATSGFDRALRFGTYPPSSSPPRAQVMDLFAVFRRAIERHFRARSSFRGMSKPRAKFPQLLLIQFFLLVRDVLAFARLSQPVALDRPRQNHRRRTLMFRRGFVRRIHFARIVPAQPQPPQRFIGARLDQLQTAADRDRKNVRARTRPTKPPASGIRRPPIRPCA